MIKFNISSSLTQINPGVIVGEEGNKLYEYDYVDEDEIIDSNEDSSDGSRLVGARAVKSHSEAPFMAVINPHG